MPPALVRTLDRTLGARDLTLLVVGNVIGSGVFLVPALVMRQSGGSLGISMAIWLAGGALSLLGALAFAELGGMDPEAGGLYAYLRDAFGPLVAFLYGWTLFFVIGAGTVAGLSVAAADYLTQIVPLSAAGKRLVAVALIVVMTAINVRGTRQGASVQNTATAIKIGAILLMSVVLYATGSGPRGEASAPALPPVTLPGIGLSVISVLWAYEGWQYVTFVAGEARDPQRTIPTALVAGTLILIGTYLLANGAYAVALGPQAMAASERVAGDAVTAALGPAAGRAIAAAILVSMYSAAHATVITVPRVYFAMAADGLFFRRLAEVHPRFGTPAVAIVSSSALAVVLALSGTFEQLLTAVVFVGWIFYGLGAAAVIVLRIRRPDAARPFRVPGYPLTPAVFVLAAVAIVGNTILTQPGQSLLGLGVVALGVPAYLGWRSRRVVAGLLAMSLLGPPSLAAQPPTPVAAPAGWRALLDDSLAQWEVWTGVPDPSVTKLPPGYVRGRSADAAPPIGLGDPMRLFTVARQGDGRRVLRISGEVYGGLTTRASFSDYHLTLEVQWGTTKWPPRLDDKRDSGLLYHCQGPHGAFWKVWKRCLEFQIQEGDFGDLHQLAGPRSLVRHTGAAWSPGGGLSATSNPVARRADHESAPGRWTRIDLYVVGDRAAHVVNGQVVLAVDGARTAEGQPLTRGQLQLQSEGAALQMRDIRLRPLRRMPDPIARAAGWLPAAREP